MAIDPTSAVSGGLIIATLSAMATWRITSARMEGAQAERDAGVARTLNELKQATEGLSGKVSTLSEMEARFSAAQETLNKQREAALQAIQDRLDRHEEELRDHGETLRLTTELLARVESALGRVCKSS